MQRLTKPMVELLNHVVNRDKQMFEGRYANERTSLLKRGLIERAFVLQYDITPSGKQALKEHLKKGS